MNVRNAEVRRFLASSANIRIASLTPKGHPTVTPLWFADVGGRLVAGTSARSALVRGIATRPRVVVFAEAEWDPGERRHLRFEGQARAHVVKRVPWREFLGFAIKYGLRLDTIRHLFAHRRLLPLRKRYYAQGAEEDAALVEIVPESAHFLACHDAPADLGPGT
jgi:hypothetical protein